MFPELTRVKLEIDKVEERLHELKAEKEKLVADGARVSAELFDMLADDATMKDTKQKQKELEQVEKELDLIERKIQAVSEKNAGRLNELLVEAKKGQDRELAKEQNELDTILYPEAKRQKAIYLWYWVKVYEKIARKKAIRQSFLEVAHKIGCHDYDRGYFDLVPVLNLTANVDGQEKMLAPTENEILDAYRNGKVQPWVRLFIETNGKELVENNQVAEKRLKELAKKEGEK